ncbi:MAG: RNA-binding S4 domain-containing protein [Rhodospirillales bacterium]|jgi:ribosome-associated heat shock protein Hsp15|nr:RNA-binding S4 domain-containing protein [Rhodospirillales bacterium]MBT4041265.1 RNA-binding S4 domain-containing protein [Rhodospirillales bacterium]MBT4628100.1 RNA-binding S4 domain-containing protein [Rhodospirillales bacterium]MBT5351713.1 RNA-binding S4 domain-containing protein [Rhodospirillales bacterium]MBT6109487.1 RNA-binding S4 domain-containing protein [Rhodospirillales bacterium]
MTDATLRMDKWLWYTRFFKSRTLAGTFCGSGKLRLNGQVIRKSNQTLKPDDVLTFPLNNYVRVIKVVTLGTRRGPALEAQGLYEDLDPPVPVKKEERIRSGTAVRDAGAGRPTKTERRATDKLRDRDAWGDGRDAE